MIVDCFSLLTFLHVRNELPNLFSLNHSLKKPLNAHFYKNLVTEQSEWPYIQSQSDNDDVFVHVFYFNI